MAVRSIAQTDTLETFRTQFNGFYSDEIYEVEDNPIMTLYKKDINKATLVA